MLVFTGPFTPMLFMGEEWAASTPWAFFTSHPDEELGEATRKGRLEEFARMGWDPNLVPDPQALSTFTDSKLDWREPLVGEHAQMLQLYRDLAQLRRARAELTDPRFGRNLVEFDDDDRWLLINRSGLRIAVNISDDTRSIPLGGPAGSLLLATAGGAGMDGDTLSLPAHTAVVIAPEGE